LGNSYDWVGALVKHGLIPSGPLLDFYYGRVIAAWEMLNDFTAIGRRGGDLSIWEIFEYLYIKAKAWEAAHPTGNYPKGGRLKTDCATIVFLSRRPCCTGFVMVSIGQRSFGGGDHVAHQSDVGDRTDAAGNRGDLVCDRPCAFEVDVA